MPDKHQVFIGLIHLFHRRTRFKAEDVIVPIQILGHGIFFGSKGTYSRAKIIVAEAPSSLTSPLTPAQTIHRDRPTQ